jgi:virulence-associated protein VagC
MGISELTNEQVQKLCEIAENAAREYVTSKVSPKKITELNIIVEAEGDKPLILNVEIDLTLSPLMKDLDAQKLADQAVKEAFASAEKYLREIGANP